MSDFDEEEQFGDDEEYIVEFDDDDELEVDEDLVGVDDEPEPAAEEPERDTIMDTLISKFNPKTGPARRLLYDLREVMANKPEELGFSTQPKGTDIFNWEVRIFGFEKDSPMYADLQKYKSMTGRDYVEMCVTFPPDYPDNPPFVRVVQPRFQFHTGRVTVGGSLCTDVLTRDGWRPIYNITSLMVNIFSEIMDGKPRIDFNQNAPYSLQEAKNAFQRVARDHGWKIGTWLPSQ